MPRTVDSIVDLHLVHTIKAPEHALRCDYSLDRTRGHAFRSVETLETAHGIIETLFASTHQTHIASILLNMKLVLPTSQL